MDTNYKKNNSTSSKRELFQDKHNCITERRPFISAVRNNESIQAAFQDLKTSDNFLNAIDYFYKLIYQDNYKSIDFYSNGGFNDIITMIRPETEFIILKYVLSISIKIVEEVFFYNLEFLNDDFCLNLKKMILNKRGNEQKIILEFVKCMLENESMNEKIFLIMLRTNWIDDFINDFIFHLQKSNIVITLNMLKAFSLLCNEQELNLFTPFLETNINIIYFGEDFKTQNLTTGEDPPTIILQKDNFTDELIKKIRREAIFLLSILLRSSDNCKFCYNNNIEINLLKTIQYPIFDSFTYSYDCIYHLASKGFYPNKFKTILYYNLTENAIQNANKSQIVHIIDSINVSYQHDWIGLWDNDIVSDILSLLKYSCFEVKECSLNSILKFCKISQSEFHIQKLLEMGFLDYSFPLVCSLSKETLLFFFEVLLYIWKLKYIFQDIILQNEPISTFQQLLTNEDTEIRNAAECMYKEIEAKAK